MQLPGLTARLEVDYKQKIPAGTVLLVTTEVEAVQPRKVWMKASVCNGEGSRFATGRALFVAPNIGKHFGKLLSWTDKVQGQLQQQVAVAGAGA
jgi:acyl-CoA thioesterase FadM